MNMSVLRALFLVVNHIAKAKRSFTVSEELILATAKDMSHELLGRIQFKRWHVLLFQLVP